MPETFQGGVGDGNFKTALFDVTRAEQSLRYGGLGVVGLETEHNKVALTYQYSHTAADVATLAVDTRGKEYFFPGYDPNDPMGVGHQEVDTAPYIRTETLEYTERTADSLQLSGQHTLPIGEFGPDTFRFTAPELTWTLARSSADLDQPDKRQFAAKWLAPAFYPATPFLPEHTTPAQWYGYAPGANFTLGNLQRTFKTIEEDSDQYSINLKWPFKQWTDSDGYVKAGLFDDDVHRKFNQDTFSNFNDHSHFDGGFDDPWSQHFPPPEENHAITASNQDVDYRGEQEISAWYTMADLPLNSSLDLVGGARFESTKISIVNKPEPEANWFPPIPGGGQTTLNPGDADVDFSQHDVLPSIGAIYTPVEKVTLRASYSQTVARQTFKELSPIIQQEFAGGPVFIGNPDLEMSALQNYDLRGDYAPYEGGLISLSWFKKDIDKPIEYVERLAPDIGTFTSAANYPKGRLDGYEVEVRQDLSHWTEGLQGFSVGANATFIDSEVRLPQEESHNFETNGFDAISSRDMTNAPDHLYNLFLTYDLVSTGTQAGLFYTVQGDTLLAGAGVSNGNFVPSIYAKEYDTLNFTVSQKVGPYIAFQFQAKNLTNPKIEEVYRDGSLPSDVTHSSYTKGIDYSISLTANFSL